jgi:hypothetical protein
MKNNLQGYPWSLGLVESRFRIAEADGMVWSGAKMFKNALMLNSWSVTLWTAGGGR